MGRHVRQVPTPKHTFETKPTTQAQMSPPDSSVKKAHGTHQNLRNKNDGDSEWDGRITAVRLFLSINPTHQRRQELQHTEPLVKTPCAQNVMIEATRNCHLRLLQACRFTLLLRGQKNPKHHYQTNLNYTQKSRSTTHASAAGQGWKKTRPSPVAWPRGAQFPGPRLAWKVVRWG